MFPFIVVGGLLIAIALTLDGEQTPGGIVIPEDSFWSQIEAIGAASFSFMVPILAGLIAYSITDRTGLVPGFFVLIIVDNGIFYVTEEDDGFIYSLLIFFLVG